MSLSDYSDEEIRDEYFKRSPLNKEMSEDLKKVKIHMGEMYPNLKNISIMEREPMFPLTCDFVMFGPKISVGFNVPKKSMTRVPNLDIYTPLKRSTMWIVRATLLAGVENYMAMDPEYSKRSCIIATEIPKGKMFMHPETFCDLRMHVPFMDTYWEKLLCTTT